MLLLAVVVVVVRRLKHSKSSYKIAHLRYEGWKQKSIRERALEDKLCNFENANIFPYK